VLSRSSPLLGPSPARRPAAYRPAVYRLATWLLVLALLAGACRPEPTPAPTAAPTPQPSPTGTPATALTATALTATALTATALTATAPDATASPPAGPALVLCLDAEPQTLFAYGGSSPAQIAVLDALAVPLVATQGFAYQARAAMQVPSLAGGDVRVTLVPVADGDRVYDLTTDEVITLPVDAPVMLQQLPGDPPVELEEPESGEIVEAEAVQVEVTWTLADGLAWEDGTPLTAEDFLYAWQVMADPGTPASKDVVERTLVFEAPDSRTLRWVGVPGYRPELYAVSPVAYALPRHRYAGTLTPAQLAADEQARRRPLSYGPFSVADWRPGEAITLTRNPAYPGAAEGLPRLAQLVVRFVPDPAERWAQLAAGACDVVPPDEAFLAALPELRALEAGGRLALQIAPGRDWEHIDFNARPDTQYEGFATEASNADGSPVFADARVRQAVAHCLDRPALIAAATGGAAFLQDGYLPAGHPLNPGEPALTRYGFDPERGRALLLAAGWADGDGDGLLDRDGLPFAPVLSTRRTPLRETLLAAIAEQLRVNCGIAATPAYYGVEYFSDGPNGVLFGRRYDLGAFAWQVHLELDCLRYMTDALPGQGNWGGTNVVGYGNPAFDEACRTALQAVDPARRAEAQAGAQGLWTADLPSLPLFSYPLIALHAPDVRGVAPDATAGSLLWNVDQWDR
jgi:peptide/nickel transport system substrate-binding protein